MSDERAEPQSSAISKSAAPNSTELKSSPWRCKSAVALLAIVTVFGFFADIGSKWLAFQYVAGEPQTIERRDVLSSPDLTNLLASHNPRTVVPSVLEFSLVLNPGAVFGIGAGKRLVFIAFTLAALGFGLWMFGAWTQRGDRAAHVAIALLLAGGLGNLYDRLRFACVRDFIHPLPGVKLPFGLRNPLDGSDEIWPYVSNVADLFLLIGIGMLMVFLWRGGRQHKVQEAASAEMDTESASE